MFALESFGLTDILECSSALRRMGQGATTMEGAATAVVRYLYDNLIDKNTGDRAVALARLFKTHRCEHLPPSLRAFASTAACATEDEIGEFPCLTLLGTAGDDPAWNDRRQSVSHQAIPLMSAAAVASSPMIAQLLRTFGVDVEAVLAPDPSLFRRLDAANCGVFHVADAANSPYVPDQEFVRAYGIRSVLGFGGVLPSGYVFAVLLFTTVAVPAETADAFATVAHAVNLALLPFIERHVFEDDDIPPVEAEDRELRVAIAEAAALSRLLDVRQEVVLQQALRLEQAVRAAEDRADELARSRAQLASSEARKSAILDAALDSVITMDRDGRIIEFNPAAEATFGYTRDEAVGEHLATLIIPPEQRDAHARGLSHYIATGEHRILDQRIEVEAIRRSGERFPVELTVTPVVTGDSLVFTGYLRDITESRRAAEQLQRERDRSTHIARTLQASLLPPSAPQVAGLDIAFEYRFADETGELGGDFYDVFQIGKDDWAIVLGDVMGKGADAAALTALARYTTRAAAINSRRPAAVLNVLNSAVHRQHSDRFCTAVYARLRLRPGSVRMTMASGGHLAPLLRRGSGDVIAIEARGMLLGPFEPWEGQERRATIHAGEALLLYSDGVTEARRGREIFGQDRLADVVAGADASSAHLLTMAVREAVADFATVPTDDLAVMAVVVQPATAG